MLAKEPYVHLIAIDLSKAFDNVRRRYLAEQLAEPPLPDMVYNWVVEYLKGRSHRTKFGGVVLAEEFINASILQGSWTGPWSISWSRFQS